VIKFFNDEPKEIIGDGNVMIEDKNSIVIGNKFFYYLESEKQVVYEAQTYNKPYFIRGDYFKFIDKNNFIASDISFSNCEMFYPHYSISAKKAWIYKDDKDFFFGFSLKAGQDPIFYFPFMYKSYYGTGIITSIGNETIGWFVNNTYKTKGQSYDFKFMFDHYQRLGEYFGINYKLNGTPGLDIKTSLIYDKHIKYTGTDFTNFFEEVSGEGPVSGRSMRYKVDVNLTDNILNGDNILSLNTSMNIKYFETSDPFIQSQYETRRLETFDANKILFPQESPSSMALQSGGTGQGRTIYFALNNTFYGFSLNLIGDFKWILSMSDNPSEARNPYKPDYYKNYKSSITFPSINFSKSFSLFNINSDNFKWPFSLSLSGNYVDTKSYSLGDITSESLNRGITTNLNMPLTYNFSNYSLISSFAISNIINIGDTSSYSSGVLSREMRTSDITTNFNNPISFNAKFNTSSLTSSVPLTFSYKIYKQETKNPTITDIDSDRLNSYKYYSYNIGTDTKYSFLEDYEYLNSSIQARMTYSYSKKYDLPPSIYNTTSTYNYFASFNTLMSSITFSTFTNTSPGVTGESREGPINIGFQSQIIPFFSVSNNHVYSRYEKRSKTNDFSITSSIKAKTDIFDNFWLNSFSFTLRWYKDYINFRSDYINYNMSINFNITRLWELSFVFSGQNNRLYYYTDKVSKQERRDFFDDLIKSLKIWSIKDREYTYFKMNSFGFNVKHNLHKWYFEFTSSFTPRLDPNGSFYFESLIGFKLVLTEIPGLSPPEIKKEYGK